MTLSCAILAEIIENLILHAVRKVGVIFIRADVLKGKDRNALFWSVQRSLRKLHVYIQEKLLPRQSICCRLLMLSQTLGERGF